MAHKDKKKKKAKSDEATLVNGKALVNGKDHSNGKGQANGKDHAPLAAHGTEIPAMRIGKDCNYEKELSRLQIELVKLHEWVRHERLKVSCSSKAATRPARAAPSSASPRRSIPASARSSLWARPLSAKKRNGTFSAMSPHLPAAGEMVLFDRSWYNRAGVERVMGFCTDAQYQEFLLTCPEFERMLVRSGIILIKYWFSVSDAEQERRFQDRMTDPTKRWKISPMDLESRKHWADYSRAKDDMFNHTTTNRPLGLSSTRKTRKPRGSTSSAIFLSKIPYKDLTPEPMDLPPLVKAEYVRPPFQEQHHIPVVYR
jgi:polyphosphate kinase